MDGAGQLAERVGHQAGVPADLRFAHRAFEFGLGDKGGHGVDDHEVHRAGTDQHVGDFKGLLAVSARAARTTSVVMLIVATATAVGWFITSAQIPMQVAELFQPLVDSPILLLLSINVFLFLAGMVMDLTPNVLIFAPVFYPLIQQAGIDPYFFGLLFILNLGIGVITPPVGTVLYVVCGIGNIKIGNLVRNMAPFLIVEMLVLFLLLFFPSLSIEPMKFLMK